MAFVRAAAPSEPGPIRPVAIVCHWHTRPMRHYR